MHRSEIVLNCKFEGLNPVSFGFENCNAGHYYGPALRTHWLLHYIKKGSGIFERGGKTYRLGAGDIFIIPPYEETFYKADDQNPWEYSWIGFTCNCSLPETLSKPFVTCPEAGNLFEQMRLCKNLEGGKSAYLTGCLWQLMSIFYENVPPRTDYIDKALSFIHAQYSTDFSVSELAGRLNLDRSYFSTMFKNKVGVSPALYIRNYRLSKAAELITLYGEKPRAAANSVGFEDIFHFSKCFKARFGMSPRQYIQNYQDKKTS